MKKITTLLVVLICNFALGANTIWTGGAGTTDWFNSGNWDNGVPVYNTDSSLLTYIGVSGENANHVVTITGAGGYAKAGKAWLGIPETAGGTYTMNMDANADLYLVRLYIGTRGIFNMNSGKFDTWEGRFQGSKININGGEFIIRSYAWAFFGSSNPEWGITTLNGGTLRIKNGEQNRFSKNMSEGDYTSMNNEFTGIMDFRGGELVMDGDCRIALNKHILAGNMIAYGGDTDYELQMIYDSQDGTYGTTTVTAVLVPEPATMVILGLGGILAVVRRHR